MRTIEAVFSSARRLFPAGEYGYGSMMFHPGARIAPLNAGKRELVLGSAVPREFKDGRYYPAWECFEASYYLADQLKREGYSDAMCVRLKNPVYPVDFGVEAGGRLLSLTPGIVINDYMLSDGHVASRGKLVLHDARGDIADMNKIFLGSGSFACPVSGAMMNMSWTWNGDAGYLNSFGIYFDPENDPEFRFQSEMIKHGFIIGGAGARFSIGWESLRALKGLVTAGKHAEVSAVTGTGNIIWNYRKVLNFIMDRRAVLANVDAVTEQYFPQILRIMDVDACMG